MAQYVLSHNIKRGRFQILLTTFLINLLSLALPIMLLQIYDRIIPNQSLSTASLLISGVATAILIESAMRFARAYLMAKIGARFEYEAGLLAFDHILHSDIEPFEAIGSGKNMERFNALGTVRDYFSGQAAQAMYDLPFGFIFLCVIGFLGKWAVCAPILLILIVFWLTFFYKEKIEELEHAHVTSNDARFNFLIANFNGLHSLKALGMEGLMLKRYEALQETYNNNTKNLEIHTSRLTELGMVFSQVAVVGVISIGALLVIQGRVSVGSLAACTILTGRAMQLFLNALNYWAKLQQNSIAKQRFDEIFQIPKEKIRTGGDFNKLTTPLKGEIELKNVSFRFSVDTPYRLRRVDMHLHPRELVAVTGRSGSGKSVLLELIRSTYLPTEGLILLDNERASFYNSKFLKKQIAYVSDEEPLFRGTIMENLTLFRPEKVEYALASTILIGVDDTIKGLPQGYQTLVGTAEDASLPLGLQQRIAIARVLVDQPRILLFDEANSSDDQIGDKNFQDLLVLLKSTHTVVIVTQRPSVLKKADQVYELQEGHVTKRENNHAE